jgi:hypothetical protein
MPNGRKRRSQEDETTITIDMSGLDDGKLVFSEYLAHNVEPRGERRIAITERAGSGEWIGALWPVCHISDIGHLKPMGAALTYPRRYGLSSGDPWRRCFGEWLHGWRRGQSPHEREEARQRPPYSRSRSPGQ